MTYNLFKKISTSFPQECGLFFGATFKNLWEVAREISVDNESWGRV
jgi:hypothetical protein